LVKVGDEFIVRIETLNHQAQGIARIDGYVVFVDYALPDELLKIRIIEAKKEYGRAEIVEIVEKNPHRKKPECPVYYECGGCHLMHASYNYQLEIKKMLVEDAFKRIGKLSPKINPVIGMENPFRYRNKVQFPVGKDKNGIKIGFYKKMTHEIVPTSFCLIQHEDSDKVIEAMARIIKKYEIEVYNENLHTGVLRHIMVRRSFAFDEMMILLVCTKVPDRIEDIKNELVSTFPNLKSLYVNINNKKTNVILGEKDILIWGSPNIKDKIGNLLFEISPKSFFQVNTIQTEKLYNQVVKFLKEVGGKIIFDLYSGIGTISMFVSPFCEKVYAIEIVKEAVEDAKKSSLKNGITNVEFILADAEKEIQKLIKKGIVPDTVILDPPRKGCEKELLESLIATKVKNIIYVSCNPSTLARDAKIMADGGYEVIEVQPVDMFSQTYHVENVTLFRKRE